MRGKLISRRYRWFGKSMSVQRNFRKILKLAHLILYLPGSQQEALSGTAVEEAIKLDIDQLAALLFTADHAEHLAKIVKPALGGGK